MDNSSEKWGMGKGETFSAPHVGNGSKDSKWWFTSVVILSKLVMSSNH
jgi:hypothetical protein